MDRAYTDKLLAFVSAAAAPAPSDPQTILLSVYSAIIQGDFDALHQAVTDDVELHICGFGTLDGTWRGRDEVVAATRNNYAQVTGQQPEILGMISQDDSVAVLLRETGTLKSTGQPYTIRGVQWFTFAGGKIRRIDEIIADSPL